jgi:outer membrane protein TolC
MANSVYDIILTKYQNSIVDNIAYLDALSKKTTNQALYNQALNNYEIAKANYYFSSGVDYKEVLKMKF